MNSTAEATVASRISTKMLAQDTRIGSRDQRPCDWRSDIRDAIPAAIESLASQASSITAATDDQIGRAFIDAVNAAKRDGDYMPAFRMTGTISNIEMGAWLRAAYAEAVTEAEVERIDVAYPATAHFTNIGHHNQEEALRVWADNGVDDVKDGVDEQINYLRDLQIRVGEDYVGPPVPRDGCEASGETKDHVGAVMRYKKARLSTQTLGRTGPLTEKPAAGTRIRVTDRSRGSAYHLVVGEVAVVEDDPTQALEGNLWLRGKEAAEGGWAAGRSGGWVTWSHINHEDIVTDEPADVPEVKVVSLDEPGDPRSLVQILSDEAALKIENTRLATLAATRQRDHEADISLIGERLQTEAARRSWCSEYDQIVDSLNGDLNVELPVREREVEVSVTGYIRVPFSVTVSVTASGETDESDLEEQAIEQAQQNYSARTLLSDFCDHYDAETEDDWSASID